MPHQSRKKHPIRTNAPRGGHLAPTGVSMEFERKRRTPERRRRRRNWNYLQSTGKSGEKWCYSKVNCAPGAALSRAKDRQRARHRRGDTNRDRNRENNTNRAVRAARVKIPAAKRDKPSFLLPSQSPLAPHPRSRVLFFTHMGVTNAAPEGIFIGNTWYRNLFKIFINSTCVQPPRPEARGRSAGHGSNSRQTKRGGAGGPLLIPSAATAGSH